MTIRWSALVLAAGKGTRMKSDLAKVLHRIEGRTLLQCVLDTAARLPLERTIVVIGHQADAVRAAHPDSRLSFALQEPQLGTGHAVMCARDQLEGDEGSLLVLYGDVPLLRPATLLELMERHETQENAVTVLTARLPDPSGYGRIVRNAEQRFHAIVEDRDLSPEQRGIDEINSGIYTFRIPPLLEALSALKNDNAQREYYLTDTLGWMRVQGFSCGIMELPDPVEISGINTPEQLEEAERVQRDRRAAGEGVLGCPVLDTLARRPELVLERRNGLVVALAPAPYTAGHLWITPGRRVVLAESLPPEELIDMLELARRAEGWLEAVFHPQGFNIGYNSGWSGRQLVLHVVPRWSGDANFMPVIGETRITPETVAETKARILAVMDLERREG